MFPFLSPIAALERRTRPRQWLFFSQTMPARLAATQQLLILAQDQPAAQAALHRIWHAAEQAHEEELICAITAAIPTFDPTEWIPRLLSSLERLPQKSNDRRVREAAIHTLKELGNGVLPQLVARVFAPGDDGARWALHVIREAGLRSAGSAFCAAYAGAAPPARELFAQRAVAIRDESWDDLLALLAGVAKRVPKDHRLVEDLVRRLGAKETELKCVQFWTRTRSADARALLELYFRYSQEALK